MKYVGKAQSSVWSPLLNRYSSLSRGKSQYEGLGTKLELEHTALYERKTVSATVVETPFFEPERKRTP